MKEILKTLCLIAIFTYSQISLCLETDVSTQIGWDHLKQEWPSDLTSPLTGQAQNLLWLGGGLTILVVATQNSIAHPLQESWSERKPLGSLSRFGDLSGQMLPNIFYLIGFGAHYYQTDSLDSHRRAWLMTKASAYSGLATTVLKYSIREPRPDNGNERNAFPSGHSTSAFAFASVVASEHEWYYGVASYALATFVAASRINDNRHWLQDVVAGATIGASYGIGLAQKYTPSHKTADDNSSRTTPSESFAFVIPTDDMRGVAGFFATSF